MRNHATGHVEWAHVNKHAFDEQFQTFNALGYAVAPDGSAYVGDAAAIAAHGDAAVVASASDVDVWHVWRRTTKETQREYKKKSERDEENNNPLFSLWLRVAIGS